jgi:hypothetical protein
MEESLTCCQFSEDDFESAESRAEEFDEKGIAFAAHIYDEEDLIETIQWDLDRDEIVYVLSYYGKLKGYRLVAPDRVE